VNRPLPLVFRMTGAFKIASAIAALLMCLAGGYLAMSSRGPRLAVAGVALACFGAAGFVDALISRIVLDQETIRVVSLARRRTYARAEFESAKVDGGAVCLKRKSGGWLVLPSTGANSLSVRNTIDAWIKK